MVVEAVPFVAVCVVLVALLSFAGFGALGLGEEGGALSGDLPFQLPLERLEPPEGRPGPAETTTREAKGGEGEGRSGQGWWVWDGVG